MSAEDKARIATLESLLRDRDAKAAEEKAAAIAAAEKTEAAKSADERAKAAAAELESVRRGSWLSHLLGKADPAAPVDFQGLESQIPKDGFPPGVNAADFVLTGGARIKPEEKPDVQNTTLGKMLQQMGGIK